MPVAFFINFVTIRGPEYSYLNNECVTLLLNFQNVTDRAVYCRQLGYFRMLVKYFGYSHVTVISSLQVTGQNNTMQSLPGLDKMVFTLNLSQIFTLSDRLQIWTKVRLFYCNKILYKFSSSGPKIQQGSHQKDSIRIMFSGKYRY